MLPADDKGPVSVTKIVDGAELLIPMAGLINKEDELARLAKEVAKSKVKLAASRASWPTKALSPARRKQLSLKSARSWKATRKRKRS